MLYAILAPPMTTCGRLSFALVLIMLMTNSAAGAETKRVLIVHSAGGSAPPDATHSTAFQTTLIREMGQGVDIDEVSLDVTRYDARRTQIADLAGKNRVPSVSAFREDAHAGGLISYGPSLIANRRRAAVFVDKIFKGAKPADLPVEQPAAFEMFVNLRTAKALGLTIPVSLLLRADQVIE